MENILIVENDEGILNNLEIMLETEGYNVLTAGNGLEALKKMERTLPDLIIADVKTPYMDGMELRMRIKARNKINPTPFIVMVDKIEIENYLKEELINDLIAKPFMIDDILEMIENKLEKKRENKLMLDEKTGRHIAHRLRSPLTPMLSFLELLINGKDISKENYQEILERVMTSANTLYNSVETFLFFYEKRLNNNNDNILPLQFNRTFFDKIIKQYYESKKTYKTIVPVIEPALVRIDKKGMERLIIEIFHVMRKYFDKNTTILVNGNIFNEAYLLTINAKINPFYKSSLQTIEIFKQHESELNVQDINTIENIIEMYGGKIKIEETNNESLSIKLFFQVP